MAKTDKAESGSGLVKVRVLVDGAHGKVNDVVELDESAAASGQKDGVTDSTPEAVAYAESLVVKEAE